MARRGQVVVARDRLYVPTSKIDPNDADPNEISFEGGSNVAKVVGAQKLNDRATITLDDGSSKQNIFPPVIFPTLGKSQPTLRVGSTVSGVSGTLTKERNKIVLVPNKPLDWEPAPRPKRPEVGDADVTVASFNVLNYFTTIDNGSNNARGADSKSEFDRQERKLVAAIIELQADVVGLMELENNLESESRLVAALNKKVGSEVFKGCGLPEGFDSAPGGKNAIRVGIIYRSDRIKAIGDVSMIRDDAFDGARTPLVQSFQSGNSGKPFSVVVNHFKSKGGSSRAGSADKNKGDGQGAYNATRRSQSLAICNFIAKQKPTEGSPRVLVIGDLNAYGEEDPIDAMRANGLADLQQRSSEDFDSGNTERHYSYIYRGQSGSLDHAMATDALAADVTGVATWHINADEPRFLDYNEEYKPKSLYKPDPFRSSDHDPVLIGIKN
jgi:predicted extracellular nuclease